ncbi:SAM-dependent methyltransferase [Dactylosporangium fulvum]|uniref:SAM-dependent methyltransferase n=1 Tax=Dactylosporangium fulvum TaxID=53359 RepID=UPI0029D418C5|nr:SAM-dependent methyltransferase [Dactylosporangium fulvum]
MEFDTSTAQPARRYNYWLGGKDHFAADRESGDLIAKVFPTVRTMAVENRAYLRRATRFLAAEAGVRQFLDIGCGLPAPDNTHEIAQAVNPAARVVYSDNDPIVMAHARALLTGTPEGRTAYVEADVTDPAAITGHPTVRETLDFGQPVGVLLLAVLHFIEDDDKAARVVRELMAPLPPGSYVVVSNSTKDFSTPQDAAAYDAMLAARRVDAWPRDRARFTALFDGLELVEPGVVGVPDWRPESGTRPAPSEVALYGAVARKP